MHIQHNQNVRNAAPSIGLWRGHHDGPGEADVQYDQHSGGAPTHANAPELSTPTTDCWNVVDRATGRLTPDGQVEDERVWASTPRMSWRWKPNLTVNFGARWRSACRSAGGERRIHHDDLSDTAASLGHCGHLSFARCQCNLFEPGNTSGAGVVPNHLLLIARRGRLQHRLEQHRAEYRRGVAAERGRRLVAGAPRRPRGHHPRRLLVGVQPRAHGPVHRSCTNNPGGNTGAN